MKKESNQAVTKKDMNIPKSNNVFPISTSITSDGKMDNKNLEKLNLDKHWLNQQLHSANIPSISDVFYAEVQQDGSLYIDRKK